MKRKNFTNFRILDISSLKYYKKEIILSALAVLFVYFIISSGRNYVITHEPLYVLQENTFFDLKYFHTGLSVDEHETMLDLLKNLSKTDLKKNILNDSVKFRETVMKSKAWDGALEDRCNLYICYDEKTANYYLFEVLR